LIWLKILKRLNKKKVKAKSKKKIKYYRRRGIKRKNE